MEKRRKGEREKKGERFVIGIKREGMSYERDIDIKMVTNR